MLIRTGPARTDAADRRLAWSLAGIAGALNTAGFYAAGLYSSNMTGNVSSLANQLGSADAALAGIYTALIAIFVAGAALSTLLINAGRRRGFVGIYAFSILAEGLLLAALAAADLFWTGEGRGMLLAFGLSFSMGLQNAIVTRLSGARVRTTHVTGMLTDIGIELGHLISRGQPGDVARNRDNLRLHGLTVFSFLSGGILGVVAYRHFGVQLLFAASAALLSIALHALGVGSKTPELPS